MNPNACPALLLGFSPWGSSLLGAPSPCDDMSPVLPQLCQVRLFFLFSNSFSPSNPIDDISENPVSSPLLASSWVRRESSLNCPLNKFCNYLVAISIILLLSLQVLGNSEQAPNHSHFTSSLSQLDNLPKMIPQPWGTVTLHPLNYLSHYFSKDPLITAFYPLSFLFPHDRSQHQVSTTSYLNWRCCCIPRGTVISKVFYKENRFWCSLSTFLM